MRIRWKMAGAVLFACALPLVCSAESVTTPTGFYYPVGTDNLNVSGCG
jgi:hypothetical protein